MSNYKSFAKNHQAPSAVGKLFEAPDPTAVPDIPLPSKRMICPKNGSNGVIGGYDDSENHWQTTAKSAMEGERTSKGKHSCKKMMSTFEPEDLISPITGNRVANYGTWAEDLKAQRAAALAAEEEEESDDNEAEQDPLMARLKTQLASRGATGIIGLARLFKIMDDDRSNTLCFAEFKKAMREFKVVLTEVELVVLFKRFGKSANSPLYSEFRIIYYLFIHLPLYIFILDRDGTGSISHNNFLTAITVCKKETNIFLSLFES